VLPPASEEIASWIDSMVSWFEERLAEARTLAGQGELDEARDRIKLALDHIHRDDPLVARTQSVFPRATNRPKETAT
jgi:hypothetical protein